LTKYSDYSDVPPDFVIPAGSAREVFTEIINMTLKTTGANGCCSNQGGALECYRDPRFPTPIPPGFPMVKAGPLSGAARLCRAASARFQSHNPPTAASDDFPARSFFDIFCRGDVAARRPFPMTLLRNPTPMVVTNQALDGFPPTVIIFMAATTAAPLLTQTAGVNVNGVPGGLAKSSATWCWPAMEPNWIAATRRWCRPLLIRSSARPTTKRWAFRCRRRPYPIPTISQWGLIILGLLVLSIGTAFILRRRTPATA
jgi:hypothetical protein